VQVSLFVPFRNLSERCYDRRMSNPITVLRSEGAVIAQAPWSFALCLFVVGSVIFLILRALKAQEIADLNSRLTLRNDEISDYRRKLDGKTPDEAKNFVEALEVEVAVEADAAETAVATVAEVPAEPAPKPKRVESSRRRQLPPVTPAGEREVISMDAYEEARAKTGNMTSLQAARELDGLIGKWRTLRAPLFDIRQSPDGRMLVFVKGDGSIVGCRFRSEWIEPLSELQVGADIALVGRIASFSGGVQLDDCELV